LHKDRNIFYESFVFTKKPLRSKYGIASRECLCRVRGDASRSKSSTDYIYFIQ